MDGDNSKGLKRFKIKFVYLRDKFFKNYLPGSWFNLNKNINVLWVESLEEKNIPDSDFLIATSWHTAVHCNSYSQQKGKKIYFIQSLETWHGEYEDVIATWKMPFRRIVISKWLLEYAKSLGLESTLILNGFDFNKFGIDIFPENRNPLSIGMLFHINKIKGSKYGIHALSELKAEIPDLKVNLFGVSNRDENLPEWMDYIKNPDQEQLRSIYNNSSIFINPSIMEGFALTPAEAMICGCAVVVSDIGGHKDYSINEETALLFESENPDSLKNKINILIKDNNFRIKLAYSGKNYIKNYTWDKSFELFEKVILDLAENKK